MTIKAWLNSDGIEKVLLNGAKLVQTEREIMEQKLSEVRAQFITDFGMEGEFDIVTNLTRPSNKYGTCRTSYRIVASNTKTTAILKHHPGWLAKFIE